MQASFLKSSFLPSLVFRKVNHLLFLNLNRQQTSNIFGKNTQKLSMSLRLSEMTTLK